ncbi:MAG TPA: hypothetical protein ENK86_04390 [Campylobacterales bacterium]|nr:hypothetical protein [Campylobacterales bacterium]
MDRNTCFETIKIKDGRIHDIKWHNQRCNRTRRELFGEKKALELQYFITPPDKGLYRCRITYHKQVTKIEYIPYTIRTLESFKIVQSHLDYAYKYSNRTELEHLKNQHPDVDEIIIEKNGVITDTSIANLAFYDGQQWITPSTPLLEGTVRAKLLSEQFLIPKVIKSDELKHFSYVALMNAMIGFRIQKNSTIYDLTERVICL